MAGEATEQKRVIVVGGGFAGINVAKRLGRKGNCDVILIDRNNHHLFQPLLYQVAMAGLDPSDIASPIRSILSGLSRAKTMLGEVTGVDLRSKLVTLGTREVPYDYLVLACGAGINYFGNQHWEKHAPGLKSIPQATEIRRRVLLAFEQAEDETDAEKCKRLLTFVVIGGGPTGVELAGAIADMARKTLRKDFHSIDSASSNIILIEGGERVLDGFDPSLSDYAVDALNGLGVDVQLGRRVSEISADGVQIGDDWIPTSTAIWAAGVAPSPLGRKLGTECDKSGRVIVADDLSVPGHPGVFVIGDLAAAKDQAGNQLPGIAPVAIQQGKHVAKVIAREASGQSKSPRKPFRYFDKGQMATIGRRRAVLEMGRIKLTGTIAWLGWLFVHILFLNGLRNRTFVFLSWVWSYFLYSRGARLIIPSRWRSENLEAENELKAA